MCFAQRVQTGPAASLRNLVKTLALPKCSISGSRPSNRRMLEQDLRMEPSEACVKFCIQVEVVLEWSQGLLNMIRTVCDMELL